MPGVDGYLEALHRGAFAGLGTAATDQAAAAGRKAWGRITGGQGLAFMQQWQQGHPLLMLSFEALVAEPGPVLAQLQDFLAVAGIDPRVLEQRINNLTRGLDTRHGHSGPIVPATLTAAELALVETATGAVQLNKLTSAPGS